MTIRQDMIKASAKAESLLGDSARLVERFIASKANDDGGFAGRSPQSDLYYTVFALESMAALGASADDTVAAWLKTFGDGDDLDLVHLGSLAKSLACTSTANLDPATTEAIATNINKYKCPDGSYSITAGTDCGDVYGCFIATGALEDIGAASPDPQDILQRIRNLRQPDGGYANEQTTQVGSTPATAAAVTLLHYLDEDIDEQACDWLLGRRHTDGGFVALPGLDTFGAGDLLSTATALHALTLSGVCLDSLREPCLDFIDSLWSKEGAFQGSRADATLDCEYTYYGLLALGHLAK